MTAGCCFVPSAEQDNASLRNKELVRLVVPKTSPVRKKIMTAFNQADRVALASRNPLTSIGPIFSSLDMVGGILAAVMTLGPLAMAAFAVGRY
jgi:hypothetical protein